MKPGHVHKSKEKIKLHPRNKHQDRYNFESLIDDCPDLKKYVSVNQYNTETIDFTNPKAVKTLNRALLKHFYKIDHWDIPEDYLCPPVPGRADYVHNIADILASSNAGHIPKGKSIKVLDIGVGANSIYPLIGHQEYGWNFIGTDIDSIALKIARQIINSNSLMESIEFRQQNDPGSIFNNILKVNEKIDITMCNPPFHSSAAEAQSGSERKWKNLKQHYNTKTLLNFGGQGSELWCQGGEVSFIKKMIEESVGISKNILWFSSLVSKSENLPAIYTGLKKAGALSIKTINMSQGNKTSRLVAWSFLDETQHIQWSLNRWK